MFLTENPFIDADFLNNQLFSNIIPVSWQNGFVKDAF
jgi:hypothetical protein